MNRTHRTILFVCILALAVTILVPAMAAAQEPAPPAGGQGSQAPQGPEGTQTTPGPGSLFSNPITMMLIIILIFWFVVLMPQRKQQKKHQERVNQLKSGDRVVTSGGLYGTVRGHNVDKNMITLEIAKGVQVQVTKSSVSSVIEKGTDGGSS